MVLAKGTDSIGDYLREVRKIPLLSDEEVIVLGRKVREMVVALKLKTRLEEEGNREIEPDEWASMLNIDREKLELVLSQGRSAKKRMIEANLRLVISIAKKYQKHLPLQDLIQEGSIGLSKAVIRFDATRGCKLSTYIYYWIRQAIIKAINSQSRAIRLPSHVYNVYSKAKKAERKLINLGRNPSLSEVAEDISIEVSRLQEVLNEIRPIQSLNLLVDQETKHERVEFMYENAEPIETLSDDLGRVLDKVLTPKQRLVVRYRFGFVDGTSWTRKRIGEVVDVSPAIVRQIEMRALKRLKQSESSLAGLRDYIE